MTYRDASYIQLLKRAFSLVAALAIGIAMFAIASSHPALATDTNGTSDAPSCGFSDASFDPATDVNSLDEYTNAIAMLLKQEKFSTIDCLADSARATKARFSGGYWKLRNIYVGLELPRPGHPTQEDWRRHFELIRSWAERNPRSITARIALAESYVNYAWDARGDGYTDSVSDSAWKVFRERNEKAKEILDRASALPVKCPEWYLAMQRVGRGLGWDLSQLTAAFERAAHFESDYQNYYAFYAVDLLPKWSGQEGDAARFAEQSANKIGGDDGDILYFQIGMKIVCACQDRDGTYFSWPRLQKGFAATEKKYGPSLLNVNYFAMMAVNFQDWVAAVPAFQRIGDDWVKDVWITEQWFTSNRDGAARMAPLQAHSRATQKEAESNMQAPEWESYRKGFEEKLAAIEQSCLNRPKSDTGAQDTGAAFDLYVNIGKGGGTDDAWSPSPTPMMQCVMRALYDSHVRNERPFPAPPKAPYWVVAHVDPSKLNTAMK
jgi:Domain of unknown function (DUF4034)